MTSVSFDPTFEDDRRRAGIFGGDIFVFSPRPTTIAYCDFARELVEEAFGARDPLQAQFDLPVEEFVAIVAPLKPRFIHHPKSKEMIRDLLEDFGCDLEKTYFDVPRMRVVSHGDYLTAGVGHRLDAHRDTWWSAPMCQLNWWLPVFPFDTDSSMAFQLDYWDNPVKNTSGEFNYYRWNATGRKDAAKYVKADTRPGRPDLAEEVRYEPELRLVVPVGGMILFSGAQLHSTVPNTSGRTRFSIDFRTVNIDDVAGQRGAPNIDSEPTGVSLRDFMRGTDRAQLPEELITPYDGEHPPEGVLVFRP